MTSTNKNCTVLHCESGSSSDVELFDFPPSNDPRYAIWIGRTFQGSQWTPSSTSAICSRHFRPTDILTTDAADDSGRSEKRLKYDALPCVFECLPESARPQAAYVPRPDSPEIICQEPKQRESRAVTAIVHLQASTALIPAADAASFPTCPVDEDPNVCCVPGCPSRRHQGVLLRGAPAVRFHAFPTDKRLQWEWTKRVRCSVSWQPGPSVVCSAHFVATDYELSLISGMLFLKSTAVPSQLACVEVYTMGRTESPGVFDRLIRLCAICGCWRMRIQKNYKPAARLAFVPFPTDPDEREKWNALCKETSDDTDLFACENHFMVNEIASRFQQDGEEKFTVRNGVMPRVEATLWLDPLSSPSENEIPRVSALESVCSTPNYAEIPLQMQGTVSNTQRLPKLVLLVQNGIPSATVQLCSMPGSFSIATNLESAIIATEVCCVPGCSVTASNAGGKGVSMLRFISRANSRYTTWINRIRCATTWVEKYPLAICSKHFLPEDFDPLTQTLVPHAVPSQLSCISAFHFSGLREEETDVTGMQVCAVCEAKRKPGSTKSSECLKFFHLPGDPVGRSAWCQFISAVRACQIVDTSSLICENHFLPMDFIPGGRTLKPSAVPCCTFRLQSECRPLASLRIPVLAPNIAGNMGGTQVVAHPSGLIDNSTSSDYQCCVSGCKNNGIIERDQDVTFFKFVAAGDPRYATWLERVRTDRDWIPDSTTMLCSDHFLPSQIILRVMRGATKRILSRTALPSLLNGECRWQPNELEAEPADDLKRFGYDCCMPGCENKQGRLGSKEVKFLRFVSPNDPRYDTWLHRVRPDAAWVPDIHARICNAHFLTDQVKLRKNGNGKMLVVLSSSALPSLVNGEIKWEPSDNKRHPAIRARRNTDPKQEPRINDTKRFSYTCCVAGCGNKRGRDKVNFFRFPASDDPRYNIWLERVRPSDSWIPTSGTKICNSHFLPAQVRRHKKAKPVLDYNALPSLLNGECMWEPNELVGFDLIRPRYLCCVAGCGNMCSQTVSLFNFVKPEDPRYETWLQRVRPETDWIPNAGTKICSEHFLPFQIKFQKGKKKTIMRLNYTALPSQLDGQTMWEPADFRSVAEDEMEASGTRRFLYNCCVPGCGNVRNNIGSKNVLFFKFIAPEGARYNTWLGRLQYNSAWIPKTWMKVCSEHFLEADFVRRKQGGALSSIAIPSQLLCMTALCGFIESDMISEKIGCVICGLIPLSTNRKLKSSERLQFFRCPVGEIKAKWIDFVVSQAAQVDSGKLTQNVSWYVCENHFVHESFEPQTENVNQSRCLLADAIPSVPFTLELDYIDPRLKVIEKGSEPAQSDGTVAKDAKRRKEVDGLAVFNPNPSNYSCVVPGCRMSSRTASRSSSERVTFHVFPSRSSARFNQWVERIRCAVSWSPNLYEHICNLHFLPEDFIGETSKGKQPRTRQIKKTTVPSQFECVEKFRSPREMDNVHDGQIQTCCICGCWRPEEKGSHCKRSERLTFFSFPVDDDQREMWVEVCRKSHPEFVLSDESVVCENHFQRDDLICVYKDKRTTKLVLESNAVPSGRNFAWPNIGYDDVVSENYLFDASDVDIEDTMDGDMVDQTETDYEDVVDTQLQNDVSSMDENRLLPSSAINWQISPDNGLPEDDAGDTFMNALPLMADLSAALPSSMADEPTESPQPLLAANGALMYCAKCQVFLQTPCWLHSNVIPDEPVISLAVGSLPNVLYMDVCDDSPNAVFAKDTVPRHTVFGPLVAPLVTEEDDSAQYFAVAEVGVGSRRKHYRFESDHACNWMKYVRWADSMEASNLLVFARGLEIVFVTTRAISSREELKVWYSPQYLEMIMDVKPFIPNLIVERDAAAVKPDAVEVMDIVDGGASLGGLECEDEIMSNVSFQNLPVTIIPASTVPPLPETLHGDLGITMNQTQTRKKRSRAWRDDTSSFFNRNICQECSTRFRLSDMLELHKYSHSQSKGVTAERPERQCPECRKEFPSFDELLRHVNNHGTKLVACPVCDDLCSTTTLTIHVKRYHPESSGPSGKRITYLDCHECGLRFPNALLYRMHKHKHGIHQDSGTVRFTEKCPECKEVFEDVDSLVEHVAVHGKPIGKCPVCDEWYGGLRQHIMLRHPTYPIPPELHTKVSAVERTEKRMKTQFDSVTCCECCLRFPTDLLFRFHKCKHGNEEFAKDLEFPQKCPECAELFADLGQLVEHVDDHGRRIKKCPVCRLWFASLNNHIRRIHPAYHSRHGSQRGYRDKNGLCRTVELFCRTCTACGMRFPMDYLCQLHNIGHGDKEIVSTLELPMKCPQCDEVCQDLDELVEHVDLHGKASQKCHVCDLWVSFLPVHMRRTHPDCEYLSEIEIDYSKRSQKQPNLTCLTCGVQFPTELLGQLHSFQHRPVEDREGTHFSNECPHCHLVFQDLSELAQHVDEHGTALKKCPVCKSWSGQLTTHMRHSHPGYSKNLTCRDCGLRFQTDALYQLHKYKHENKDGVEFPQPCPECGESFEEFDNLMDHIEQHGSRTEKCPVCHQWYSALKMHMHRYHPVPKQDSCTGRRRSVRKRSRPLQHFPRLSKWHRTASSTCYYCGICFPAEALCQLHLFKHGRREYAESLQFPQECPECCEVFSELHELLNHVEKHGERVENGKVRDESLTAAETETCDDDSVSRKNSVNDKDQYSHKGHECPECGKEFRLRIGLQAHLKTCRRRIKCVICSETFESKSDFDQHVASHQTDGGFLCGICLEKFSFYRLLVAHVERHGSENPGDISSPYKCVLCHNGFASSDELNKHVKGHEGRDGFTCGICSEKLPFYRLLARHVSDEHRPADAAAGYSCTICDSAFSRLNDLEMHLFTHDAELQFACEQPQCGKRFVSMKSLQGHVSGFHKKREASRHKPLQTKRKKGW